MGGEDFFIGYLAESTVSPATITVALVPFLLFQTELLLTLPVLKPLTLLEVAWSMMTLYIPLLRRERQSQ